MFFLCLRVNSVQLINFNFKKDLVSIPNRKQDQMEYFAFAELNWLQILKNPPHPVWFLS